MAIDTTTAQTRINEIDALLAESIENFSHGDRSISRNLDSLREERRRLMNVVSAANTSRYRKVVFKSG